MDQTTQHMVSKENGMRTVMAIWSSARIVKSIVSEGLEAAAAFLPLPLPFPRPQPQWPPPPPLFLNINPGSLRLIAIAWSASAPRRCHVESCAAQEEPTEINKYVECDINKSSASASPVVPPATSQHSRDFLVWCGLI